MRSIAPAIAFATGILCAGAALADSSVRLLHFNDWHSRIEPVSDNGAECPAGDPAAACTGGAARLAAAIAKAREQGGDVLLLNAGDNFVGSLFYTQYRGAVEAELLVRFGVDAMAIGNHELSNGEAVLADFAAKVSFPLLAANLIAEPGSPLAGRIAPSTVLEVGGTRIGIVGAVTNSSSIVSGPGTTIRLTGELEAVAEAVKALEAEGIDRIIALTHVGYPLDLEIARIPGIDVVVGGHSHTVLHNSRPDAAGPYPTWVDNPAGYRVPVVQAGAWSMFLGDLTVTFDDEGIVTAAEGAPILLDASVGEDPAIRERIGELSGPIEALRARTIAEATDDIDGSRESCRARECAMGNLVADAMLERAAASGVTIAVVNGGAIRTSIARGEVSRGNIIEALPFGNTLATFRLKGADLVAALEHGVSGIEDGRGRFPQVAGLRMRVDLNMPAGGGRVSGVEVRDSAGNWIPIDAEAIYGVATNNYLRQGGDGYAIFRDKAADAYDFGPGLDELVADYLMARKAYTPYTDGRIAMIARTGG